MAVMSLSKEAEAWSWRSVASGSKEVCQQALELDPRRRAEFLDGLCGCERRFVASG